MRGSARKPTTPRGTVHCPNAPRAGGNVKTARTTAGNSRMKNRREFFKTAGAAGLLGAAGLPLAAAPETTGKPARNDGDRRYWVSVAEKLSRPVLEPLARRELKKAMPVESLPGAGREKFTH